MIGARLRAYRTQFTPFTLEQAAEQAQMSVPTLSRTENGRRHVTVEDVATLLTVYRVPRELRTPLIEMARSGFQDGVWQSAPLPGCPIDADGITSLEAGAHRLTDWCPSTIPPLLQTPGYAAAVLGASGVDDIERHVEHRIRRQEVLRTTDYTAFVHAPVLDMADDEQLAHLQAVIERGVGVRIVPARVLTVGHPWLLMEFLDDPPVVHIGLRKVGIYLHEPEADGYHRLRDRLDRVAWSGMDTRRLLDQARSTRPTAAARRAMVARESSGRRSTSAERRDRPVASRWVSTVKMSDASGSSAATAAVTTAGTSVSGTMAKISAKRVSSSL
ncbi:helix-turn-helix transcriptional regulator [Actinokineospora sp. UTMC 2448]|uniref:helix-turn-helix domain-containing protein n=1 Tax=Actinokineospora sp. UTMC 2448 TaxID=2268449 RepID=UPI0021646468|nr:helix-turn-helix transcriptional regulator [Actinokineospora sp. UTMC 2448]